MLKHFLLDPKIFNYALIGLYVFAAIRWSYERRWWDAGYWAAAAVLTLCITMNH